MNSELESFVENLEKDSSFPFGGESHYYAKSAAGRPRRCKENVVKSFHSDVREREKRLGHIAKETKGGNSWPYFTRVIHSQLITAGQSVELGGFC